MDNIKEKKKTLTIIIGLILIATLIFTPSSVLADDELQGITPQATIVILNPNGGQLSSSAKSIELTGNTYSELSKIPDPKRTGYKFEGWYSAVNGGVKVDKDTNIASGVYTELFARWSAREYTVTFNGKGGKVSKNTMKVSYGNRYGTLATATKSGYGFLGWFTSSGSNITADTIYKTDGNTTLYAKWGKKYKITFNPNKGKVGTKSKTVTKGLAYGNLPTPKRSGYTFQGWYTKKSGGSKITSGKTVGISKNTTFYAHWSLSRFKLNFNANGGKVSKQYKNISFGKTYGTLPKPSRKGYNFKGWYSKKKGGSKVSKSTKVKSSGNRTIYARWTVKKIKIKFNGNGGKVSKKSKTISYGKKYGSLPTPKRSGYKFKGWYSSKSGGVKYTKSSAMKYTKSKTLYARWAKISKVTFKYQGGKKTTSSKKITYGEQYGTLPSPKRAGYTFTGWYTNSVGGTQITSATVVTTKKNISIYAQWDFVMAITPMYAPAGSTCRPGYALNFGGVTIHNTDNTSSTADALNHAKYLQGSGKSKSASWHYCVDQSNITQSIPENEMAWHAGDGRYGYGNSRTIAIEICMNNGGDLTAATDRAAKLAAYILAKKGQTIAISNVNLFQHYDFSKKNCPSMIRKGQPYNWATFVKKVNSYL